MSLTGFGSTPASSDDAGTQVVENNSSLAGKLAALQILNARLIYLHDDQLLYEEMINAARKIIGCDFCALYTHDSEELSLVLRAWSGYHSSVAGTVFSLNEGNGILLQAFLEEYLVCVHDVAENPEEVQLDPDVRSALAIPIVSKHGPVGIIQFASRRREAFSDQDIHLCSMLVDQMAFCLENIVLLEELTATRDAVIHGMALLAESRDGHIGGHLKRICSYARHLARRLHREPDYYHRVDEEYVEIIARSAALHDIGKVGIPDTILLKPDRLTDSEYEIMKTHSSIGGDLLEKLMDGHGSFFMLRMGADVAYGHHERWDGKGYPRGRRGEEIPLAARIVSICDFYDALISRRIYKDPVPHDRVCEMVQEGAGAQFDPHLVEIFLSESEAIRRIQAENQD